jgi:hypothetical protein
MCWQICLIVSTFQLSEWVNAIIDACLGSRRRVALSFRLESAPRGCHVAISDEAKSLSVKVDGRNCLFCGEALFLPSI